MHEGCPSYFSSQLGSEKTVLIAMIRTRRTALAPHETETEVPRIYEPIALSLLSMKLSFDHVEDVQIAVSDM